MTVILPPDTTLPFDVTVTVLLSAPNPAVTFVLLDTRLNAPPLLFVVIVNVVDAAPGRYAIAPLVGFNTN